MRESTQNVMEALELERAELEQYFADTTQPLEERWALWVETPDVFKNTECFYWKFKCFDLFEHFEVERYMTVHTVDLYDVVVSDEETEKFADALREEILAANLSSFIFDW